MSVPRALTIAGSDSGGGAGIQADLKTFEARGVYGASAITAITAQNTTGVQGVLELPPELVAAQIDAVLSDIGADAVKTGMLSSSAIVGIVADRVVAHDVKMLVVDPVMIAKSGDPLLAVEARQSLVGDLLPLALVVTPNLHEAAELCGEPVRTHEEMLVSARLIHSLGPQYVVVKGGHLADSKDAIDVLYDGDEYREFRSPRIETDNTHGTGCTFASAIAAELAKGSSVVQAVGAAKDYLDGAIRAAAELDIGHGHGPVAHFWEHRT